MVPWVSPRGKPVKRIFRSSALSSPLVSLKNSMWGAWPTTNPPFAKASDVARLSPSAKTVTLSATPSLLVSSRIRMRSCPRTLSGSTTLG